MFLVAIAAAALLVVGSGVARSEDQCVTCHRLLGDDPSRLFARDIHAAAGVSCAGCHGGDPTAEDPEAAMSPSAGFVGVPTGDSTTAMCAACHSSPARMKEFGTALPTDQQEQLSASVHGSPSLSGGRQILQCTSCHQAHGIVSVREPSSPVHPLRVVQTCTRCHADASYMRNYNPSLPVDQLSKYRTSVHGVRNAGGDSRTAQCASCHGGHEIRRANDVNSSVYPSNLPATCASCHSDATLMAAYGLPTDQLELFAQSVHGVALLEKGDLGAPACNDCHGNHGAAPPGVESVSHVCGTCHALNAELFAESPHKTAFDALGLPECETCHGNHDIIVATDALLGNDAEAVCSQCHDATSNPRGYAVAGTMRRLVDTLARAEEDARLLVEDAEQKGMEITEAKFTLRDARQARLEGRTMVHSFNEEKFKEVISKGLVASASAATEATEAIDEYHFRRFGLGVSTLIISSLALALFLTLRRIEKKPRPPRAPIPTHQQQGEEQ